jgi:hypothetical protein
MAGEGKVGSVLHQFPVEQACKSNYAKYPTDLAEPRPPGHLDEYFG